MEWVAISSYLPVLTKTFWRERKRQGLLKIKGSEADKSCLVTVMTDSVGSLEMFNP